MERLPIDRIIGRATPLATREAAEDLVRQNAHNLYHFLCTQPQWCGDRTFLLAMAREITRRRSTCRCSSPRCTCCSRDLHKQLFALVSKHLWKDILFCKDLARIGSEWWYVLPYRVKRCTTLEAERSLLGMYDRSVVPRPQRPHERVRRAARATAGRGAVGA